MSNIDVFLSYNSADRQVVASINTLLKEEFGLRTWYDQEQILPGETFVTKLEEGLKRSRTCALFVGREGIGPWEDRELSAALQLHVGKSLARLFPVLLPGAPKEPVLPLFLRGHAWVDLRDDFAAGLRRLLAGIVGDGRTTRPFRTSLIFQVGAKSFVSGLPGSFGVDVEKVVNLLIGESLYSKKDVFVRELIQNAADACARRRAMTLSYTPQITVTINDNEGWFQVDDNGEGMSPQLLRDRFAIIGKSIIDEEEILRRTLSDEERLFLIAKFGIGFLTTFIAASEVRISTQYQDEHQLNFVTEGVKAPFRYTDLSTCGREDGRIGTTVRVHLTTEFRREGKRYVDLAAAVATYVRHASYVRVENGGVAIDLPDDWNLEKCDFTSAKTFPQRFEIRLGVGPEHGRFVASSAGFLINEDMDTILPAYVPQWIVGEINFWPDAVDLTVARDNIVVNKKATEIVAQLKDLIARFIIEYIRYCLRIDYVDKRITDLLIAYSYVWLNSERPSQFGSLGQFFTRRGLSPNRPPLFTYDQTKELLLDTMKVPYGRDKLTYSLRAVTEHLINKHKRNAYAYLLKSAHPWMGRIISWLQAQGELVFEYSLLSVVFRSNRDFVQASIFEVMKEVLLTRGIILERLDELEPEKVLELRCDESRIPLELRQALASVGADKLVVFVNLPEGDLTFRFKDKVYLNAAHKSFDDLVQRITATSGDSLHAYLLGLTQQSILHLASRQ